MNVDQHTLTFQDLSLCTKSKDELYALQAGATYACCIAIGSCSFMIHTDSAESAEWMRRRFYDMTSDHDISLRNVVHLYGVQRADGAFFWDESGSAWEYCEAVLSAHVIAFFLECVMTIGYFEREQAIGFHAAAVAHNAKICAIVGSSHAGKTTTAIACAALGMEFFSDERCVLNNGMVTPFLRSLTMRAPGRRLLHADRDIALTQVARILTRLESDADQESILPPSLFLGTRSVLAPAPLAAIVVLRGYADEPRVDRVEIFEILPILLQQMTCKERGLDRMARVMHELRGIALYEMKLGQPGTSAHAVRQLVDTCVS